MVSVFIWVVIMIKGKGLCDGFSCFNYNEVRMDQRFSCFDYLKEKDMILRVKKKMVFYGEMDDV